MRYNYLNIFLTFFSVFFINLYSQNSEDLKRLLNNNYSGTARFTSMGGAFISLGGDLSSISHNPASSSVFNHANVSFSLNYSSKNHPTTSSIECSVAYLVLNLSITLLK